MSRVGRHHNLFDWWLIIAWGCKVNKPFSTLQSIRAWTSFEISRPSRVFLLCFKFYRTVTSSSWWKAQVMSSNKSSLIRSRKLPGEDWEIKFPKHCLFFDKLDIVLATDFQKQVARKCWIAIGFKLWRVWQFLTQAIREESNYQYLLVLYFNFKRTSAKEIGWGLHCMKRFLSNEALLWNVMSKT